jgi:hypothetical protein
VRSGIAQLPNVTEIDVSVEERFVRFKFQAESLDLQQILSAIAGGGKRFEGRLVLQLEQPKIEPTAFDRLAAAMKKVKGVRQVSQPDDLGVILVSLTTEDKTMLPDLLRAAKDAGVPVKNPEKKKTEGDFPLRL